MNVCKVLSMHPGLEMSSWGTIHLPDEERILEYHIQVEGAIWKSIRWGSCVRAPKGGFDEVRQGHEHLIEEWARSTEGKIQLQMICKEDIEMDELLKLVLGELAKAAFPYSVTKEANALQKRIEICEQVPVQAKKGRRF